MYSRRAQIANQVVALALIALFVMLLEVNVGLPPTIIVGASALVGFFCWRATNLRRAITPVPATVLFLLTTAALHVHMYEEHSALFGPAMLPALYYLTAIGLLLRVPLAGFVAWFIFIGPGIAEFTHFIFPLLAPALEPANPSTIGAVINGVRIDGMANHHLAATGRYYFPGLYTAILPMIPGICAVWWMFRNRRTALSAA